MVDPKGTSRDDLGRPFCGRPATTRDTHRKHALMAKFRNLGASASHIHARRLNGPIKQSGVWPALCGFDFCKDGALVAAQPTQEKKARTKRFAPSSVQLLSLLLAPRAGLTTIGGSAAYLARRLHRSCKRECYQRYQQHCSNVLHGLFSFEKSSWFLSTDGCAIGAKGEQDFSCGFLDAQQTCFEECVSTAVPDGRNNFQRMIKPNSHQIAVGSQDEILRCSKAQRCRVPLRSDRYFERAARHPANGNRLPVARFSRSLAAGMVATWHVRHRLW